MQRESTVHPTRDTRRPGPGVELFEINLRPPRPFPPRYRYTGLGRFRVPSHHSHTIPAQLIRALHTPSYDILIPIRHGGLRRGHSRIATSYSRTHKLYASRLLAAPTSNLQPYIAHTSPRHGVACSPASSYTVFLYDITRSLLFLPSQPDNRLQRVV